MQSLILAILSSVLISLIMRFSSEKVKNNVSMLSMNYLTCMLLGAFFSGAGNLVPLKSPVISTQGSCGSLGTRFPAPEKKAPRSIQVR